MPAYRPSKKEAPARVLAGRGLLCGDIVRDAVHGIRLGDEFLNGPEAGGGLPVVPDVRAVGEAVHGVADVEVPAARQVAPALHPDNAVTATITAPTATLRHISAS